MRFLKFCFSLLFLGALTGAGLLFWYANTPLELKTTPLDFSIDSGLGLKRAAQAMHDAGVGVDPFQFSLFARTLGKAAAIKAGSYEVEAGLTPWQLLEKLTRGDVTQGELALVEGKNFRQLRALLDANPDLRHDTAGLKDSEILQKLGASETQAEGLFYPDTYLFPIGSSDLAVLRRAYRAMQTHMQREWPGRSANLPYKTPYEALIMASLIEKETGVPSDRGQVAAVFINRLRLGMLLQTDPTVIYGMGERYGGSLHKNDLTADTPYNTYTRSGLPPTPIAMPSLASLQSALHPPASDKLYFVARGDGSSEFSRTLDEHNRAVNKYQRRGGK